MKIIFECNEQEARDMLALKEQYDNYQAINNQQQEDAEEQAIPEKRRIGF